MVNFALNGDSDYQNKADETLILLKPYLKNDILNSSIMLITRSGTEMIKSH